MTEKVGNTVIFKRRSDLHKKRLYEVLKNFPNPYTYRAQE